MDSDEEEMAALRRQRAGGGDGGLAVAATSSSRSGGAGVVGGGPNAAGGARAGYAGAGGGAPPQGQGDVEMAGSQEEGEDGSDDEEAKLLAQFALPTGFGRQKEKVDVEAVHKKQMRADSRAATNIAAKEKKPAGGMAMAVVGSKAKI